MKSRNDPNLCSINHIYFNCNSNDLEKFTIYDQVNLFPLSDVTNTTVYVYFHKGNTPHFNS